MAEKPANDITQLLQAWSHGDEQALDKLMPVVHRELHRLARRYMRHERPGHTLQTTALVNEAYLRLVRWETPRLCRGGSKSLTAPAVRGT